MKFQKITTAIEKVRDKADKLYIGATIAMSSLLTPAMSVFAGSNQGKLDVEAETKVITNMISSLLTPIIAVVGAVGTLYCVLLGVKYAKAEEPQEREKAKQHLKSAIIGFVLIFVLIVALRLLMPVFQDWMETNQTIQTPPATPAT